MLDFILATAQNPREAFHIGSLSVEWYGLIIVIGMLVGLLYACWQSKKIGINADDTVELFLWLIPLAIVFARLLYVLPRFDEYFGDNGLEGWDKFVNIIAIWNGGITIIGGLVGGLLGAVFFSLRHRKKTNFLNVVDLVVVPVLLGQIIGRWGNFFNREAFGGYTDGLLAMQLPVSAVRDSDISKELAEHIVEIGGVSYIQVHPTFLYESLWNLVLLVILLLIRKRKKFEGEIFLLYLAGYGIGRAWIEGLRTDQLLIPGTSVAVSQVLAVVLAVVSVMMLIILRKKAVSRKQQ